MQDSEITPLKAAAARLAAFVDRLRPSSIADAEAAAYNIRREIAHLAERRQEAEALRADVLRLLVRPGIQSFYAESGVRSGMGFWLELKQRLGRRLLPSPQELGPGDLLRIVFRRPQDYRWAVAVDDALWSELARSLGLGRPGDTPAAKDDPALISLLGGVRLLSYRLAGTALDRELLRAEPPLERHESPFLAQNAALLPLFERARAGGALPGPEDVRDIDVLLAQCDETIARVRRRACENGISLRLTYLLALLRQLVERQRLLLDFIAAEDRPAQAVPLAKTLLAAEQTRDHVGRFLGENVSLLARNVTDRAGDRGEHYIAEDRGAWWAMARSAAGGGAIIALLALIKTKLAMLHLPPLTEGILFGLNYGLGFLLIHLLGFVVATKQPAMTAAAIAATLEETRPREMGRLVDLAQNVLRTQFVAVLGNVALALPAACLIGYLWPPLFGETVAPVHKVTRMVDEIDPLRSGALLFAAIAGVGLFLSGLVSGYFDNQARYDQLSRRVAAAHWIAWLGPERAGRIGAFVDAHYGAIFGNLFFGMYLGIASVLDTLTGLPIDIRHVAFSSANLGLALSTLGYAALADFLPWALAGIFGIALMNLAVSFGLALYVAMKSMRRGTPQILRLAVLLLQRFALHPFSFFMPPPRAPVP